jgi:hypothetical protein
VDSKSGVSAFGVIPATLAMLSAWQLLTDAVEKGIVIFGEQ